MVVRIGGCKANDVAVIGYQITKLVVRTDLSLAMVRLARALNLLIDGPIAMVSLGMVQSVLQLGDRSP